MGPFRGLNPGPPAPEAGIIPLDQMDAVFVQKLVITFLTYLLIQARSLDIHQLIDVDVKILAIYDSTVVPTTMKQTRTGSLISIPISPSQLELGKCTFLYSCDIMDTDIGTFTSYVSIEKHKSFLSNKSKRTRE